MVIAYQNDPALKRTVLDRIRANKQTEAITRGVGYYSDERPWHPEEVAVTWVLGQETDHWWLDMERDLGIPASLAALYRELFMELKYADAIVWVEEFFEIIPVGADMELLMPRMLCWILADYKDGVSRQLYRSRMDEIVQWAARLCQRAGEGVQPGYNEGLTLIAHVDQMTNTLAPDSPYNEGPYLLHFQRDNQMGKSLMDLLCGEMAALQAAKVACQLLFWTQGEVDQRSHVSHLLGCVREVLSEFSSLNLRPKHPKLGPEEFQEKVEPVSDGAMLAWCVKCREQLLSLVAKVEVPARYAGFQPVKYAYGIFDRNFRGSFDTPEQALAEGFSRNPDADEITTAQVIRAREPESYVEAQLLIGHVRCQEIYRYDSAAARWPAGSDEQMRELSQELRSVFGRWLDRHGLRPQFSRLEGRITTTRSEYEAARAKTEGGTGESPATAGG